MNKKKTTQWLLSFVLLLTATLFTACSNSDSNSAIDEENQPAGPQGSLVSFGITTNKYSEVSRAAQENEGRVVSSSTENLGNGLEALVEVVETPTKTANTRAVEQAPAGDYTILAYQGTELKQKWEINYKSNGTYTMKDGSNPEKYLAPGSYKFYVFKNQDFELENGNYVAKLENGENEPYLYEDNVTINNQLKTKLTFTLKPYFAKVKFKIKAFSAKFERASKTTLGKPYTEQTPFEGPTNGHFVYDANSIPSTMTLNATNGTITPTNNSAAGQTNDFVSFTGNEVDGNNSYISSNSSMFFLPGTDITKLKFQFKTGIAGTIYKKSIAGKSLKISNPITGGLKSGYEYIVSTTVYYTATYLFSDGTEGTMGNKGNRTPIALYVGTHNGHKFAIALNDAKYPRTGAEGSWYLGSWSRSNFRNATDLNNINTQTPKYDGYETTYEEYTTLGNPSGGKVKAENPNFDAFYAAAHYSPGVTLTGSIAGAKWYLPSWGEWDDAYRTFGFESIIGKKEKNEVWYSNDLQYQLVQILFLQAGGSPAAGFYWTADTHGKAYTIMVRTKVTKKLDWPQINDANRNDLWGATRAFIRY
ncbi:hypothetical protein [Prevotella pallens]|uniref:hypothetical protein n=1 Tax=Prevotella pallens TaxID=60133 RepID=UPI001CAF81AC|nr:hypothetical protein [Prevotella pallens]MBF1473385.1 hypothetical protein [Prevotella pallens]